LLGRNGESEVLIVRIGILEVVRVPDLGRLGILVLRGERGEGLGSRGHGVAVEHVGVSLVRRITVAAAGRRGEEPCTPVARWQLLVIAWKVSEQVLLAWW
jgi:hypothetical protein